MKARQQTVRAMRSEVVTAFVLLCLGVLVQAPPPSPLRCDADGCTLSNYQGTWVDRTPCHSASALFPASEAELLLAVAHAAHNNLHIKVSTHSSHSMSKLSCPRGRRGLVISTSHYSSRILVNETAMTVTADAGVQIRDLLAHVAEYGLALPHSTFWDGVSVAGVIATASHGSGLYLKGACLSEYVVGMTLVVPAAVEEGYSKLVHLSEADPELKAARAALGVLGAVSTVTFQLVPMFKRSVTVDMATDEDLENFLGEFAHAHDFAHLTWIPSTGKAILRKEDHVPVTTGGDGSNLFQQLLPMPVSLIESMREHQERIEASEDISALCKVGESMLRHRVESGEGLKNDATGFTGYPVVGFNHRIQATGGCQIATPLVGITPTGLNLEEREETEQLDANLVTCKWDPRVRGFFYHHSSIAIPLSRAAGFVRDVKLLKEASPLGICTVNGMGGISFRFVRKSDAYLGDREDSALVEILYYRPVELGTPRLYEDIFEEIEQMLLLKYGGRPHWGKNRDVAFLEGGPLEAKVVGLSSFIEVKNKYDPHGLFSSEWSDTVLGIVEGDKRGPHCAIEGLCICKEDNECAPEQGYFCRPGLVFQEARVCRKETGKTEHMPF